DRINLLAEVATAQFDGGLRPDAMETMKQAMAVAEEIAGKESRAVHYHGIVVAQLGMGDFDGAFRIVESLDPEQSPFHDMYLQATAKDCDRAGRAEARKILARALELSKAMSSARPRAGAQRAIAEAMARNGDIPGALATARATAQPSPAKPVSIFNKIFKAREMRLREMEE